MLFKDALEEQKELILKQRDVGNEMSDALQKIHEIKVGMRKYLADIVFNKDDILEELAGDLEICPEDDQWERYRDDQHDMIEVILEKFLDGV